MDDEWNDAPVKNGGVDAEFGGGGEFGGGNEFGGGDEFGGNNAGQNGDAGGNGCRNCGQEGHFSRDCPEPRKAVGACFSCGEEGHSKADCPNKEPEKCKNCGQEGHKLADCTENRQIDYSDVPDKSPDEAWADLKQADKSRDLDDVRDAIRVYAKAIRELDYVSLEDAFRREKFNTYIIAYEKDVTDTYTLMNLQGKLNCKYHIGYFFSDKCTRKNMKDAWPESTEDNVERLKDAGVPVDRGLIKCSNCDELGHSAKRCTQDKVERTDRVEIKCVNCEEIGHRARDCKEPRKDKFACKNCGKSGHKAADCTEPRSAENVTCKHCEQVGHFAKDCPTREKPKCRNCQQEGHKASECENGRVLVCRNCDEIGHQSRECPKPRDYSRVTCLNCGEKGHTKVRCKAPPKEEEPSGGDYGAGDDFNAGANDNANDYFGGNNSSKVQEVSAEGDDGLDGW